MKGIFIPEITVEMFRNGCLEGIEALMAEGEIYDIEYDLKSAEQRKKGKWIDTGSGQECSECHEIQYGYDSFRYFCAFCGADMRDLFTIPTEIIESVIGYDD